MTDKDKNELNNSIKEFVKNLKQDRSKLEHENSSWKISYEGRELDNGEIGTFDDDLNLGVTRCSATNIKTKEHYWVLFDLENNEIEDFNKD